MSEQEFWTIEAMRGKGGAFVQALGGAATRADAHNLMRIKVAFPEYWKAYSDIGKVLQEEHYRNNIQLNLKTI